MKKTMVKAVPPMSGAPMADMAPTAMPQVAAAPVAAPAPATAPIAKPGLQRGTHNPENNLPAHAFHGKKR